MLRVATALAVASLITLPAAHLSAETGKDTATGEAVSATAGTEPAADEKTQAKKEKPKKVCRMIRNTGFRTAARVCKTQQQWDREDSGGVSDQEIRVQAGSLNPG